MSDQVTEARKCAQAVYLACDAEVASDIARIINGLADVLDAIPDKDDPVGWVQRMEALLIEIAQARRGVGFPGEVEHSFDRLPTEIAELIEENGNLFAIHDAIPDKDDPVGWVRMMAAVVGGLSPPALIRRRFTLNTIENVTIAKMGGAVVVGSSGGHPSSSLALCVSWLCFDDERWVDVEMKSGHHLTTYGEATVR